MRHFYLGMAVLLLQATAGHAQRDDGKLFAQLNRADSVIQAKLIDAQVLATGLSFPPVYLMQVTLAEPTALRGSVPANLTLRYSSRDKIIEPLGSTVIAGLALEPDGKNATLRFVMPATKDNLALAKTATAVPIGWALDKDGVLSPWAERGKTEWNLAAPDGTQRCVKTKRPALLAGKGIELTIEQVPPKKLEKFRNPYGDGEFKITVSNRNNAEVEVLALLQTDGGIAWDDSLVFVVHDKIHVLPAPAKEEKFRSVRLKANESVSTIVNTLALKGVSWPRGGSRVGIQVALGELARTNFFYYFSAHHDRLLPKQ